ncbi:hypothetical protein C2G38_2229721 [Gigaspora rosea]|uniref:Uncharacterized protein n=1 Tax=Gigaspora rosea TaxID=44941 RepID=A0A397TWH4_9GLOM|nr:hypothetical protein C2G38_2229721 [Gigaspora rosea]
MALGSQKQKWALCYTSCVFTAGMQTMQRVEGQNAIIKSTVNSHTSVLELFKKLDEQFSRVFTIIQYQIWTHFVTGSTLIHSSHNFSPIIDAWIVDYLTPAALSIQRQEIAQAICGQGPVFEIEINIESFNISFAENTVDVPLIHLKELIPTNRYNDIIEIWELVRHRYRNLLYAKFHIMLIPKRWYKNEKQIEDMSIIHQQHFTDGFQESSEAYINVVTYVEMPYKIANISYEHIHKSLNH